MRRCMDGKSSVQPFRSSVYGKVRTKASLEVVHSDVTGPMRVKSQGGAKYMVPFIDDFSRFIHAYFIQSKCELFSKFAEFKALVENQFEKGSSACVRTMLGIHQRQIFELMQKFRNHSSNHGSIFTTTERMNRTLTERARCMSSHMQVEEKWWAEAINTAVYVTNRVP